MGAVLRLPLFALLVCASVAGADDIPTLHFEEVGAFQLDLSMMARNDGRIRLLVQDEGRTVVEKCDSDLAACNLAEVVNGLQPNGYVLLDGPVEASEIDRVLADRTFVPEISWPEGPAQFLPLEDGKRLTWSETSYGDDGAIFRFDVTLDQSCCLPVPPGIAALSDELWFIEMKLKQVAGERRSLETRRGLWDPELGWFVTFGNAIDFGDGSGAGVQYTRYRVVRRIDGP